jgi:hypothetical protein
MVRTTAMPWNPPLPPLAHPQARISYWRSILAIPDVEPGAALLRSMAAHRLLQLGALSRDEILALHAQLGDETPAANAGIRH